MAKKWCGKTLNSQGGGGEFCVCVSWRGSVHYVCNVRKERKSGKVEEGSAAQG